MESAFDMPMISLSILMAFCDGFFFGPSATSSLALSLPDEKVVSSSILAIKEDFSVVQLPLNTRLSYGNFQVTHTVSTEGSPESFGGASSGVAELGVRLCLTCPFLSFRFQVTTKVFLGSKGQYRCADEQEVDG